MAFLRWFLIACVLLRLAAGTAWAMDVQGAEGAAEVADSAIVLPCHTAVTVTPASSDHATDQHPPAGMHPASGHCFLCFSVATVHLTVQTVALPHSVPATPTPAATPWQPLPELRPPI